MEKEQKYTASKTLSEGRNNWVISFRNPLRKDARGKYGLKMRRGLGTSEEKSAQALVQQMNELLGESRLHSLEKRQEAETLFDPIIVSALYDGVEPESFNPEALRDSAIPLPSKTDGYSKILFTGTTGAGKTSLLRHFIGSNPDKDGFPSTSTAKTTVADIEIVTADGPFDCIATFFSESEVLVSISECIVDACVASWDKESDSIIAERLLNHRDQKFRLRYIIGPPVQPDKSGEEWSYEGNPSEPVDNTPETFSPDEIKKMEKVLARFLDRTKKLAASAIAKLTSELNDDVQSKKGSDREAAQELFEDTLQSLSEFDDIVNDIRDEILERFEGLTGLTKRPGGWPESCRLTETDRTHFIRKILWFSSNHWAQFGRLLTPIVQGIRVKGPLFPSFAGDKPRLVLIDGQGLGHTPDIAASVTTRITRKYSEADVILLVDNAEQPMQVAPLSVLRSVAASGYHNKLAIAFTHVDEVKGRNLPSFESKQAHVLASLTNGLSNLREVLGKAIIRPMEKVLPQRCFFFAWLDKPITSKSKEVVRQFHNLFEFCKAAIKPEPPPPATPIYDATGIGFAVQTGARKFQTLWDARLGFGVLEGVTKQHFARLKALNKRIALNLDDEFDNLMPVAELVARLSESIAMFLNKPLRWDVQPVDDTEAEAAIAVIRQSVFKDLDQLARKRLLSVPLTHWLKAYSHRGHGSASDRAKDMQSIYRAAAPVPGEAVTQEASEFLAEVRKLVQDAIEGNSGKLDSVA